MLSAKGEETMPPTYTESTESTELKETGYAVGCVTLK